MQRIIKAKTAFRNDLGVFENNSNEEKYYRFRQTEYYRDGRLYSEIIFNRKGEEETVTDYYYYDDKKLKEKEVYYPSDKTSEISTYKYNEAGEIIEEGLYYDKELYLKQINEFDENGNQLKAAQFVADGNEMGFETFEYNDDNLVIKHLHYNELSEPDWEIKYEYNDKKQVVKETNIKHDEDIMEYTLLTYNEHGKNTRSETYDAENNLVGFVEVEYDEELRPFRYTSEAFGFNASKMINQVSYNSFGKVAVNEFYDVGKGYLVSRESYEYDDEGKVKFEEQFDAGLHGEKKTHYKLQYAYEFFADEIQNENSEDNETSGEIIEN